MNEERKAFNDSNIDELLNPNESHNERSVQPDKPGPLGDPYTVLPKEFGKRGIVNEGNTCYINSLL
jgi:ubiquitin C-terminal hydrolase